MKSCLQLDKRNEGNPTIVKEAANDITLKLYVIWKSNNAHHPEHFFPTTKHGGGSFMLWRLFVSTA